MARTFFRNFRVTSFSLPQPASSMPPAWRRQTLGNDDTSSAEVPQHTTPPSQHARKSASAPIDGQTPVLFLRKWRSRSSVHGRSPTTLPRRQERSDGNPRAKARAHAKQQSMTRDVRRRVQIPSFPHRVERLCGILTMAPISGIGRPGHARHEPGVMHGWGRQAGRLRACNIHKCELMNLLNHS